MTANTLIKLYGKMVTFTLYRYNYERPHRGYRNMGKRPIETFEASMVRNKKETKDTA